MSNRSVDAGEAGQFDVMTLPGVGRFLKWRHARTVLALPLLLIAALMIFDGLVGPQLAPKNLATVLTWVHYRGVIVLVLLLAGNLFCTACPFMVVRNGVRRFVHPARMWPRSLRSKWFAAGLFALLLFAYELFDLWAAPLWTAWLIAAYFVGAVVVDSLFAGFAFCKHVCPLGQFNFLASTLSPLEVKARDLSICAACPSKDCITGREESHKSDTTTDEWQSHPRAESNRNSIPGCQLWLYQPGKVGNVDCTFCLDCAHACPYDNVGILARLPAEELGIDARRSGIGRFSRRADLAALAVLFTFGALLNAFAMVSPVYALEQWLADLLGTTSEALVLGLIFVAGLVLAPALLIGPAAWLSGSQQRASTPTTRSPSFDLRGPSTWAVRFSYALIPLGFGVWLAHYTFHFLTGFWTVVPVVQSFVADLAGTSLFGSPNWQMAALVPAAWLNPLELGFLGLGWFGSLLVAYQIAVREAPNRRWRALAPWAVLVTALFLFAIWLMGQPMEMRGTFLAG